MRTLDRYIGVSFLVAFVASLVVLTFVLSIGVIFKLTELITRNAALGPLFTIFISGIPSALALSIPFSILVATLLVFGRFSADGEITGMKACGISLWRVSLPAFVLSILLTLLCFYLNSSLAPATHEVRGNASAQLGILSAAELIEEGTFVDDFDGLVVYVGRKKGKQLTDIRIYDKRNPSVNREIRARTGTIKTGTNKTDLVIDLYEVKVDPFADDRPGPMFCKHLPYVVQNAAKTKDYKRNQYDLSVIELIEAMDDIRKYFPDIAPNDIPFRRTALAVEMNKRLVLSLACFAFVMIGIPLGIKAHRKESSIGIGISLFLVFNFYLFITIAESLRRHPALHPELYVWIPLLLYLGLGWYLLRRNE